MNNIIKNEGTNLVNEAVKNADIKITLEQWPCAVAVLGLCVTYAFVSWINRPINNTYANAASMSFR